MPILSDQIINAFVRSTNDSPSAKEDLRNDPYMYGKVSNISAGTIYVTFDGSEIPTPMASSAVQVKVGDRVMCLLKNRSGQIVTNLTTKSIHYTVGGLQIYESSVGWDDTIAGVNYKSGIYQYQGDIANDHFLDVRANDSPVTYIGYNGKLYSQNAEIKGNISADSILVYDKFMMYGSGLYPQGNRSAIAYCDDAHPYSTWYGSLVINPAYTNEYDWQNNASFQRTVIKGPLTIYNVYSEGNIEGPANGNYRITFPYIHGNISVTSPTIDGTDVYSTNLYYTNLYPSSDETLKHDVRDTKVTSALEKILKIRHREFVWNSNDQKVPLGYVAQELYEIDHNLASERSNGTWSYDMNYLTGLITKSIQELYDLIKKGENDGK